MQNYAVITCPTFFAVIVVSFIQLCKYLTPLLSLSNCDPTTIQHATKISVIQSIRFVHAKPHGSGGGGVTKKNQVKLLIAKDLDS